MSDAEQAQDRITELQTQVRTVERALEELRAQHAKLERNLGDITHERDEYRKLYELVSIECERMRRHLFGRKAEQVDPAQMQLALALISPIVNGAGPAAQGPAGDGAPGATSPEPQGPTTPPGPQGAGNDSGRGERKEKERKHTPHGRQKLPEHLPVERIEILPPEAMGEGAATLVRIGEEVSETLEWRAASHVRMQVVRPKFARRGEPEQGVMIADVPEGPIPRCLAGPGLLALILVNKHADHLPLNRQEKMFLRYGIHLARSTLCGWVEGCALLLCYIVEAMAKDALQAHCIAIDATGVLVLEKEKCRRGHFWVMVADRRHVLFRFTPRHTKDGPKEFLRGYKGYVQADAASVYDELYRTEEALEVGCWAHCRRYFYEAMSSDQERALIGIGFIRELFAIDADTRDLPPSERTEKRRSRSEPLLTSFRAWLEVEETLTLPKSPIAGAIRYALNQWTALTRFLDDGRLLLDNNRSERELRRQAVGRKNWLFVGSDDGAEWNAIVVSLIASCELHGIEPWAYLRDVLILLPRWPRDRVLQLAPAYWEQTLEQTDARQRLAAFPWKRDGTPSSSSSG